MAANQTSNPTAIHLAIAGGQHLRSNAVSKCIAQITEAIRTRHYLPEQKLGEATLAKELGVGKAQVRAALDQLANSGIVERRPRSGTYVCALKVRHYIELAEIRAVLEGFAARVACQTLQDREIDLFGRLADELDVAIVDDSMPWDDLMDMESQFHSRLAEAGGNNSLFELVAKQNFLARHLTEGNLIKLPMSIANYQQVNFSHRRIVDTLATRDMDNAESIARNHILLPRIVQFKTYLRIPDPDISDEDREFVKRWLERAASFTSTSSQKPPKLKAGVYSNSRKVV